MKNKFPEHNCNIPMPIVKPPKEEPPKEEPPKEEPPKEEPPMPLRFIYKNYKGQISYRDIFPVRIYWGYTVYHDKTQWLMEGYDIEKKAIRIFAIKDILAFSDYKEVENNSEHRE